MQEFTLQDMRKVNKAQWDEIHVRELIIPRDELEIAAPFRQVVCIFYGGLTGNSRFE